MEQQPPAKPKKLRQACDNCHSAKMRCGGGNPCASCKDNGGTCTYSVSNRIGRPKGTKNKRTLQRLSQQAENEKDHANSRPISMPSHHSRNSSCLGSPMCTTPTFPDDVSIDTMMGHGSEYSYSLSSSIQEAPAPMQFADPTDIWCDFDGLNGLSNGLDHSSTSMKPPQLLSQPSMLSDASISPPFDMSGSFPGSLTHATSYGAPSCFSPAASSRRSSDKGTDITIPSDLSRFQSADSSYSVPSSSCHCLEYHSELISRLKELEQKHVMPRVDVVLLSAQQALTPWKMVIDCPVCKNDDNQETLLLSAMSIRSILYRLQSLLLASRGSTPLSGSASPESIFSSPSGSMLSGNMGQSNDEIKSTIGIYEITGPEQTAVTDLLVSRTLDRIRFTLLKFKERVQTLKQRRQMTSLPSQRSLSAYTQDGFDDDDGDDERKLRGLEDLEHLEKVWRNLDRVVQRIVRAIRSGATTPI